MLIHVHCLEQCLAHSKCYVLAIICIPHIWTDTNNIHLLGVSLPRRVCVHSGHASPPTSISNTLQQQMLTLTSEQPGYLCFSQQIL